jgi:hypothetical protein
MSLCISGGCPYRRFVVVESLRVYGEVFSLYESELLLRHGAIACFKCGQIHFHRRSLLSGLRAANITRFRRYTKSRTYTLPVRSYPTMDGAVFQNP